MIGDRLRQRRKAFGMSLQNLADKLAEKDISITKAALSKYENNKSVPNAKILWNLSSVLDVNVEYFMTSKIVGIELQGFRRKTKLTKTRLDMILSYIKESIEKRIEIEDLLGIVASKNNALIKTRINTIEEAEGIAEDLRKKWGLGDRPIASVTDLFEDKGWYVLESIDDDDGFDGLAGVVVENGRSFVVSRKSISVDRKRMNFLHELGHQCIICNEEIEEKAAFRFAAAFLFPKERVFEEIGIKRKSLDLFELEALKEKYGLSIQAITYRLHDLNIISDSYYRFLFTAFRKNEFHKVEPGECPFDELPRTFSRMVHRAVGEKIIGEDKAIQLLPDFLNRSMKRKDHKYTDLKYLMELSEEERSRILEIAAEAARPLYAKDSDLSDFMIPGEVYDET